MKEKIIQWLLQTKFIKAIYQRGYALGYEEGRKFGRHEVEHEKLVDRINRREVR
jgi:flagellar biosynthesis/type III secretory pathway protein FliH